MGLSTLFYLLGLTIIFVSLAAVGILWAIKNGQYDDLDGPAQRILMDDDDPMIPFNQNASHQARAHKPQVNQNNLKN